MNVLHPTRRAMLAFSAKAAAFRVKRALTDVRSASQRWPQSRAEGGALIADVSTPLRPDPGAVDPREAHLIAGKIENLRIAVRRIDGAVVPPNGIFSFWRQVGRASRAGGYVDGRELREGCIVPSTGGGLCQLSNALYGAALDAGCEIVERHAHSQIVPGSLAEAGRDATVFWNYVDLRFRSQRGFVIRARLEADRLVVRFHDTQARHLRVLPGATDRAAVLEARDTGGSADAVGVADAGGSGHERLAASCASCEVASCGNHRPAAVAHVGRVAYLVDGYWPEFDRYVQTHATRGDVLCLPLDGSRFRLPQYAWTTAPFAAVRQAPRETLMRALRSRRLAKSGAARQRKNVRSAQRLARAFARGLTPDVEHVVVAQTLLPFLWTSGHLGGRTFDVLMTGPPLRALHASLDAAARLHPESPTLADFRAAAGLLEAEGTALAQARAIVTPHAEIARLFGTRARLLPWVESHARTPARIARAQRSGTVFYPASTLGRSGAYEMREAARMLDLSVVLVGSNELEGANFWSGVNVIRVRGSEAALQIADVVALPAFVESRPRALLAALAAGVPVVATAACGLAERANVTTVPSGDAIALAHALRSLVGGRSPARTRSLRLSIDENRRGHIDEGAWLSGNIVAIGRLFECECARHGGGGGDSSVACDGDADANAGRGARDGRPDTTLCRELRREHDRDL